jgi:penicillin-binding protein 2
MKIGYIVRSLFWVIIAFVLVFLAAIQLMSIQIVNGDYYASQTESFREADQSISAARGQISDVNGKVIVSNQSVFKVILQEAFLTSGKENDTIASTIAILEKCGEKWIDNVPITMEEPFVFTDVSEEALDKFRANLGLNLDATVENCLRALAENYSINTEKYDARTVRLIGGVRYEMERKDFSFRNKYILAEDISLETVLRLKEQGFILAGIDISEEPKRIYVRGDIAPHVIGTIDPITEKEYEKSKDEEGNTKYTINDLIGKTGIEYGMESVLKGTDGNRTIVRSSSGEVVSDTVTEPVQPGSSLKLTIDSDFQEDLQTILENQINWLHWLNDPQRGNECDGGAVVVLNAKTGAVLGMASYPTYNLIDYADNPLAVLNGENGASMFNAAVDGLFRPGSAFKTINAAAGLIEGYINKDTPGICTGTYTYYSDYQPTCTGYHNGYNVVQSLKVSCNIFFYDLARRMGIDTLSSYAEKFGYGTDLDLEIPAQSGQMTTPSNYETSTNQPWDAGQVLQAGIGQSATQVTPLNLAVQALTLANNGIRYKPYLVDSVWNYDYTELLSKTVPAVAEKIDDKGTEAFETVREGMIEVSTWCYWPTGDPSKWTFDYLPSKVAIKTGTAEMDSIGKYYTSTVMGYYPAEDPQIAFGIVLSKGEYSRYMIRNIIDAYFYDCYEPDLDEEGNVVSPWKRWIVTDKPVVR